MKIINNKEELEEFVGDSSDAYDVDDNWVIHEMDYKYPILIECLGYDHKGKAFKVRNKEDMEELKKFINL